MTRSGSAHRGGEPRRGSLTALLGAVGMLGLLGAAIWAVPAGAVGSQAGSAQSASTASVNDELDGVSCVSVSWCVAVGDTTDSAGNVVTLAERWNGTAWKVQSTPNPTGTTNSSLEAVSCTSTSACMAVGSYLDGAFNSHGFAERWDGSSWKLLGTRSAKGTLDNDITGVSCTGPSACTAVGFTDFVTGSTAALIERWNGTAWKRQTSATPPTSQGTALHGVSCPAPSFCTAVGHYSTGSFAHVPWAETWNGTSWTVQDITFLSQDALFGAISCSSTAACTTVGYVQPVNQSLMTLAYRWDGSNWNYQHTPNPTGSQESDLGGASCASSTNCVGVGSATINAHGTTLAELWNGSSWQIQPTPDPTGQTAAGLKAVSCASTTMCMAVGSSTNNTGTFSYTSLVERWNGTRWKIQSAP